MAGLTVQHSLNSRKAWWSGLLIASLALGACGNNRQEVLVGKRENLRDILQNQEAVAEIENRAQKIALGPVQSNASWSQFWGTPKYRTRHPALSAAPQLAWSANIGQGNSRRQTISTAPVVSNGNVFTIDSGATVSAVSTSGAVLWSRDLTPPNERADEATGGGLAVADGRVYVTSGFGILTVLDAADGSTLWTQDLEGTASGAPTVHGDLVYLVSSDDTAWAIEKDTGRVRWQLGTVDDVNNVIGAPAPVITDDLAIFSFGSGDIQAAFRRGGLRRWDSAVVGERRGYSSAEVGDITAPPVVDGDQIFAGNQSGRIVSLDLNSGRRNWTVKEGVTGPIWPAGDSVFAMTDLNELVRLAKSDGSRIWSVELPRFEKSRLRRRLAQHAHYGPVVAGGRVIVVSSDGMLRSFDPVDGSMVHSVEIPHGASSAPAIAGSTLYVVNGKGELLAYR